MPIPGIWDTIPVVKLPILKRVLKIPHVLNDRPKLPKSKVLHPIAEPQKSISLHPLKTWKSPVWKGKSSSRTPFFWFHVKGSIQDGWVHVLGPHYDLGFWILSLDITPLQTTTKSTNVSCNGDDTNDELLPWHFDAHGRVRYASIISLLRLIRHIFFSPKEIKPRHAATWEQCLRKPHATAAPKTREATPREKNLLYLGWSSKKLDFPLRRNQKSNVEAGATEDLVGDA